MADSQLDVQQMRGIVQRGKQCDAQFQVEIEAAVNDKLIRWCEVLSDPEIGDVLETDSEEHAFRYFCSIFCE